MGRLFDIVRSAGDAAVNKDWEAFASYYADDVNAWSPSYEVTDRAAWVEAIKAQNGPVEDVQQEMSLIAETESTVVSEWTWSVPLPSGKGRATARGLSYFTFDGDKMKTIRQYWDSASFAAQLEG